MSRSTRKHPFFSVCGGDSSAKKDKRIANKKLRAAFRTAFHKDPDCNVPPLLREVSNLYDFPSDGGRHWCGDWIYFKWNEYQQEYSEWSGPEYLKKQMRK